MMYRCPLCGVDGAECVSTLTPHSGPPVHLVDAEVPMADEPMVHVQRSAADIRQYRLSEARKIVEREPRAKILDAPAEAEAKAEAKTEAVVKREPVQTKVIPGPRTPLGKRT